MCPFSKKFSFVPASQEAHDFLPSPKPAKDFTPDWLKTIPNLSHPYDDNPKFCVPFMDTLSHGYIQELIGDIKVSYGGKNEDGGDIIYFEQSLPSEIVNSKAEKFGKKNLLPKFAGFYHSEQHWEGFWAPKAPKGYSTLFCHPLNRFDLPFQTLAGIIDTDNFPVPGFFPFLIKEGFEGLIPAGTPIYQIIFIKRDNWKGIKEKFNNALRGKMTYLTRKYIKGGYKKLFWVKKSFE